MSVVSTYRDKRPSHVGEEPPQVAPARSSRAMPWLYLILLWAISMMVLAFTASAVMAIVT